VIRVMHMRLEGVLPRLCALSTLLARMVVLTGLRLPDLSAQTIVLACRGTLSIADSVTDGLAAPKSVNLPTIGNARVHPGAHAVRPNNVCSPTKHQSF
jgi:hypothetical protein